MPALFVLLVVIFIAEVFLKESFANMNSPGAVTWMAATGKQGFEDTAPENVFNGYDNSNPDAAGQLQKMMFGGNENSDAAGQLQQMMFGGNASPDMPTMADGDTNLNGGWTDGEAEAKPEETVYDGFTATGGGVPVVPITIGDYSVNLSLSDILTLSGSSNKALDASGSSMGEPQGGCMPGGMPGGMYLPMQGFLPPGPGQNLADQYKLGNTPSVVQGKQYVNYINGFNPNDYIRKDSIPCYACTL